MILRPILILLIFFGALFYFKEPISTIAPSFDQLHSAYADSFKKLFKDITSATSSAVLNGKQNFIPSFAGTNSTSSSVKTSTVDVLDQNSYDADRSTVSSVLGSTQSNRELLPVVSNQVEQNLNVAGIVSATNFERKKAGLPDLIRDPLLSKSAEIKLQDMFQKQYFQHVSPSGDSVSDVVRKTGYEYIVVGENLALGVFAGDAQVVAAWMASPGHKKNILDSRYQEIGLAVGQGVYQGRKQWLIVQHFAKPLSSCVSPNGAIKKTVDIQKADIVVLEANISRIRAEIEGETGDAYVQKANEYNTLVIEYNARLTTLKQSIDEYNTAVRVFNACAGI
ncbi:MAG: hypothetical protein KBB54_01385 [Candidatus Pacebacteria bacterium]|nr:hypothetical protein [Candidatus Paceibacterota bacterium]MBP9818524.1 hypothetical protein [Candidatus Paceibacterota bacterium]